MCPVDEMAHNWHESTDRGAVESAVRAAGGFPTQGGEMRVDAAIRRACSGRVTG
jgi:hypothetical protein